MAAARYELLSEKQSYKSPPILKPQKGSTYTTLQKGSTYTTYTSLHWSSIYPQPSYIISHFKKQKFKAYLSQGGIHVDENPSKGFALHDTWNRAWVSQQSNPRAGISQTIWIVTYLSLGWLINVINYTLRYEIFHSLKYNFKHHNTNGISWFLPKIKIIA